MKGIVFAEFLQMVEIGFGSETVEQTIDGPSLSTGGGYTSVGTHYGEGV